MIRPSQLLRPALTLALLVGAASAALAQAAAKYFPPAGRWERKAPAAVGMDSAKLAAAIEFALSRPSTWDYERDQVRTFGRPLGPVPTTRSGTNGLIIRRGYIVGEWGDVRSNDPVYSVAKSFLSTVAGIAVEKGLIRNVNDPVASYIKDGGYASPQNALVTWKHHLQQESEWEGTIWGKNANFLGVEEFGRGQMRERALMAPGTHYEYNDARINRFALSLLRLFGRGVPDVLRSEVMDPIGASDQWRWVPYDNSVVEVNGRQIGSVSGGTRWGGGLWINSEDLGRFGLLALNRGRWGNRQILSDKWWTEALTPSAHGPDYGYLWWLNTRKGSPNAPATSFQARGNGSNTIYVDPENDLVIVWHWHAGQMDPLVQRVLAAINR